MLDKYGTVWDHIQQERAAGRAPFREKVVHEDTASYMKRIREAKSMADLVRGAPKNESAADPTTSATEPGNSATEPISKLIGTSAAPSPIGFLGLCYSNAAKTLNGERVLDDESTAAEDGATTDYEDLEDDEHWQRVVDDDKDFFMKQFEDEALAYPHPQNADGEIPINVALPGEENSCVLVKRLKPDAVVPKRGSEGAAGLDLSSVVDTVIPPHGKMSIATGVAIRLPQGVYGRIAPRSGLAYKKHIGVGAGVIDPDFTGELQVVLFNHAKEDFVISKGDRIAQLVLEKYSDVPCVEVDELPSTERGDKGFGSTGVSQTLQGQALRRLSLTQTGHRPCLAEAGG